MSDTLPQFRESRVRSFLKACSWRVLATATTAAIAWFVTGDVMAAVAIGSIEFFAKFVIYYLHERAWQLVPGGWAYQLQPASGQSSERLAQDPAAKAPAAQGPAAKDPAAKDSATQDPAERGE